MKNSIIIVLLVLICIAAIVFALSGEPHRFSQAECSLCHVDTEPSAQDITAEITVACEMCHQEYRKIQSHPTDIYPSFSVPDDMPLTDGRLTCLTCHYAHIDNVGQRNKKHYFLRRPALGIVFCSACHKIDDSKHVITGSIHKGDYVETDRHTRIDLTSLECIQCHDRQISDHAPALGAGTWKHYKREMNHPIGISYKNISLRKMNDFRPIEMLSPEMRFFDGKIGCCTCHNIYSKEKNMLVMNNSGSRLCLACHIK